MTREDVIEYVAEWYDVEIEKNSDGEYDTSGSDWSSGCYHDEHWVCLKDFVDCIENMLENEGLLD